MSLPLANDSLSSRAVDGSYPPRLNLNPNNFRYFKQAYIAYCKRTFPEGGNTLQTNTYPQFIDPLNPGGGPQFSVHRWLLRRSVGHFAEGPWCACAGDRRRCARHPYAAGNGLPGVVPRHQCPRHDQRDAGLGQPAAGVWRSAGLSGGCGGGR